MTRESPFRGIAGGTLPPTSTDYIVRPADTMLLESLRRHQFCYILSSRQMGKSSLLARAADRLREEGWRVAPVDMTTIGTVSCEIWYKTLCQWILESSNSALTLSQFWNEYGVSEVRRFCNLIVALAAESEAPLVILLDEIDSTISLSFTDDFFASLRSLHNDRAHHPILQNVVFALAGVAAPHELIKDKHRTPFNIGQRIEVTDFTAEESIRLLHDSTAIPRKFREITLKRVLYWTGGQPYLTHCFCRSIPELPETISEDALVKLVDDLAKSQLMADGSTKRDSHLSHISERLKAYKGTGGRRALRSVIMRLHLGQPVSDDPLSQPHTALKLAGIIRVNSSGFLRFTNEVYRSTFSPSWLRDELRDLIAPVRRTAVSLAICILFGVCFALWFYPYQLAQTLRTLDRDIKTAKSLHESLLWFPWQRASATREYIRVVRNRLREDVMRSQHTAAAQTFQQLSLWDTDSADFMARTVIESYEVSDSISRVRLYRLLSECGIFDREFQSRHLAFLRSRIAELLKGFRNPDVYDNLFIPGLADLHVYEFDFNVEDRSPIRGSGWAKTGGGTNNLETNYLDLGTVDVGDDIKILTEIDTLWSEQSHVAQSMDLKETAEVEVSTTDRDAKTSQSNNLSKWITAEVDWVHTSLGDLIGSALKCAERLQQRNDLQGLSLACQQIATTDLKEAFRLGLTNLIVERASELVARERSDLAIPLIEAYENQDTTGRLRRYHSAIRSERQSGLVIQIPMLNGKEEQIQSVQDAKGYIIGNKPNYRPIKGDGFTLFISGKTFIHYDQMTQVVKHRINFQGVVLDAVWHADQRIVFISTSDGKLSWYRTDANTKIDSIDLSKIGVCTGLLVGNDGHLVTVISNIENEDQKTRLKRWSIKKHVEENTSFNNDASIIEQDAKETMPGSIELESIDFPLLKKSDLYAKSAILSDRSIVMTGFGRIALADEKSLSINFTSDRIFDFGSAVYFLSSHAEYGFRFVGSTPDGAIVVAGVQEGLKDGNDLGEGVVESKEIAEEFQVTEGSKHYNVRILQELTPAGRIIEASADTICIAANDTTVTLYENNSGDYLPTFTCSVLARVRSCAWTDNTIVLLYDNDIMEFFDRKTSSRIAVQFAPKARHLSWRDSDTLWVCGQSSIDLWDYRRMVNPIVQSARLHKDSGLRQEATAALTLLNGQTTWNSGINSPRMQEPSDGSGVTTYADLIPVGQFSLPSGSIDDRNPVQFHQICTFKERRIGGRVIYCGVAHDREIHACRLVFFQVEKDQVQLLGQHVVKLLIRRIEDSGFEQVYAGNPQKLLFSPHMRQLFFMDRDGNVFGSIVGLDEWSGKGTTETSELLHRLPLRLNFSFMDLLSRERQTFLAHASGVITLDSNFRTLRANSFPIAATAAPHLSVRRTINGDFLDAEIMVGRDAQVSFEVPVDEAAYDLYPIRSQSLAPWKINEFGLAVLDNFIDVDSIPCNLTYSCFGLVLAAIPGEDGVLVMDTTRSTSIKVVDTLGNAFDLLPGVDRITGFQPYDPKRVTPQIDWFVQLVVSLKRGNVRLGELKTNRELERSDSPYVDIVRQGQRKRCRLIWNLDASKTDRIK